MGEIKTLLKDDTNYCCYISKLLNPKKMSRKGADVLFLQFQGLAKMSGIETEGGKKENFILKTNN